MTVKNAVSQMEEKLQAFIIVAKTRAISDFDGVLAEVQQALEDLKQAK